MKTHSPVAPFTFEELEQILIYFSASILEQNTEEEVVWDVVRNCISQLHFVDCVIYLLDEKSGLLKQKAAHGPKNPKGEDILQPIDIPLGKGITGTVALTGIAEIVHDTSIDPRYILDDDLRFSEIAVPIVLNKKVIGVIDCEHPEKHFFQPQHLRILTAIASLCAIKLSKVRADKSVQIEQQRLLKAQREMEELKSQSFKAQMNPHFLFNALNAVQYFITSNDKVSALAYLSLFSKLIRYRLQHFQDETMLLGKEMEVLGWYLKLQKLRYGDKFTYTIHNSTIGENTDVAIPALILPIVMESAVESTMLDRPGGHLDLIIELIDKKVHWQIKHNIHNPNDPNPGRWLNYRDQIIPWQHHLKKLNELNSAKITEESSYQYDENLNITGLHIYLKIPVVE